MERYSNGKEPHWKCGVPQGIVRSSRILSASTRITEVIRVFLLFALLFGNVDYILLYSMEDTRAMCPNVGIWRSTHDIRKSNPAGFLPGPEHLPRR